MWFLSVLKKLFAQIFAQKYWQIFILNIQSLKVTLLPSFLKYATINSSQKKDQLLSFKRKGPYLSGSLSLRTSCSLKNNNTTNCSFFFLNCFLLLMHLSLIVELPAKTERNIKMVTRYDSENLFNILVGSIWKHLQEMDRKGKENTTENFSDTIFTVKTLLHCTLSSNWEEKKKLYTSCHQTKSKGSNNRRQTGRSLLLLAFGFPVHHLPEARQDLALSLSPLLLVERCQSSLFVCAVDLVFLSQTHGLHTTMSAGRKICQYYRKKSWTRFWICSTQPSLEHKLKQILQCAEISKEIKQHLKQSALFPLREKQVCFCKR